MSKNIIYGCILIAILYLIYCGIYKYSKRKIINVYDNESWYGLGDFIKGTQFLLQNENPNNVYINYANHPISKYLVNHSGNEYKTCNIGKTIYKTDETTYHKFNNIDKELFLYCNATPRCMPNKAIINKVRQMFIPNKELSLAINSTMNNLGIVKKKFIVVHIRLNDANDTKSTMYMSDRLNSLLKSLQVMKLQQTNVIIMSNSMLTKKSISNQYGFKYVDIQPIHTGGASLDKGNNGDDGNLKGTLIEMFIMSHAAKIFQHNESYKFESGFSKRISELYDIPLFRI
jgi:hypothetical protein